MTVLDLLADEWEAALVVLGFDNRRDAEEVFELGATLQREELLDLADSALAWRDDKGKVRIQQTLSPRRRVQGRERPVGRRGEACWGYWVLNPLAGFVIGGVTGAAVGAASGALTDIGIDDAFIGQTGEQLKEPEHGPEEDLVRALQS